MQYLDKIQKLLGSFQPDQSSILNFYLNISILEGEYYSEEEVTLLYNKLKTSANEIREKLKSNGLTFSNNIKALEKNLTDELNLASILQIKELKIGINELSTFEKNVENYLKLINRAEEDFTQYEKIESLHETKEIIDLDELKSYKRSIIQVEESLVMINIALAEIDMNLDCSSYTQKKIDLCKEYLLKFNNKSNVLIDFIIDILLDKCDFLLYKIYCRKQKQARRVNIDPRNNFYEERKNKISDKNKYYKGFIEKCKKHYFEDLNEPKFLESEIITSSKIHDSCKYYRFKNKPEQIKNLTTKILEETKILHKRSFDSLAEDSAIKFCVNSRIRILVNDYKKNDFESFFKIINEEKLEDFFKDLLGFDFTDDSDQEVITKDYIPHKVILEFFNEFFDFLTTSPLKLLNSESLEKLNKGENIDSYIQKFLFGKSAMKSKFDKYLRNISNFLDYGFTYSNIKKLKPIYLSYADCKIPVNFESKTTIFEVGNKTIDLKGLSLFLDSSYVLPIDYEHIKSEIINLSWD